MSMSMVCMRGREGNRRRGSVGIPMHIDDLVYVVLVGTVCKRRRLKLIRRTSPPLTRAATIILMPFLPLHAGFGYVVFSSSLNAREDTVQLQEIGIGCSKPLVFAASNMSFKIIKFRPATFAITWFAALLPPRELQRVRASTLPQ